MIKKVLILFLTVILLAGGALAAFEPPPKGRPSPEKMINRLAKDLDLSSEQKTKLLARAKVTEEEAEKINEKNRALFAEIEKELLKDSPSSKTIYGLMQQVGRNRTEIEFKRMEQMLELRRELTQEQKTKFEKMMQAGKKRGPGGPGGPEGPMGPGGPGGGD
ncbi:MAG: periplasmic heavy metal sensor [Candidatus Margulisbacteria bacterium]|nr:periplasmic heavy metal sensor [Candidatus Margulisiibacteriota bacterium]